jgi:hypothetical protein
MMTELKELLVPMTSLDDLHSLICTMANEVPMKPRDDYHGSREHDFDIRGCIVKTTITNLLLIIEDSDDQIEIGVLLDLLKNTIILQGSELANMQHFITQIERMLMQQETSYNKYVIFKMLNNIKKHRPGENLHFRVVNNKISNIPPMSEADRIIVETKLPHMRFSRQITKKKNIFVSGEIVGCRDRNNDWWMAEIKHIYIDENYSGYWYYVEFKGWNLTGNIFSEWISSEGFRIKKYNPRKHHLKRHQQNERISDSAVIDNTTQPIS